MPVTKTKNRTGTTGTLNFKASTVLAICLLGALLVFLSPLFHMAFPVDTPGQLKFSKEFDSRLDKFEKESIVLKKNLDKGEISPSVYIAESERISLEKTNFEKAHTAKYKRYVDERRIFGWKTPRKLLIALGIRLPYLIFAILVTFLISLVKTKDKWATRGFTLLQIGIYASAFYQLIWVFWNHPDYPLKAYIWFGISLCLVSGVIVTYLFKHLRYLNIDDIKGKIRFVMSLMIDRALEDGHVKDKDKYEEEIIYPALKKLDE